MGDGAAEWGLGGLDRVDVDELMIAGGFCEQVDTRLVDGEPFGTSQFLADVIFELRYGYIGYCVSPWFITYVPVDKGRFYGLQRTNVDHHGQSAWSTQHAFGECRSIGRACL